MSIRPKNAKCLDCGKFGPVTAQRCQYCYRAFRAKVIRQRDDNREYDRLAAEWKKAYPVCQGQLPGCVGSPVDVHHKRGRVGALKLDTKHWISLCRPCHQWVTDNDKDAKKLGLSASRLAENQ